MSKETKLSELISFLTILLKNSLSLIYIFQIKGELKCKFFLNLGSRKKKKKN